MYPVPPRPIDFPAADASLRSRQPSVPQGSCRLHQLPSVPPLSPPLPAVPPMLPPHSRMSVASTNVCLAAVTSTPVNPTTPLSRLPRVVSPQSTPVCPTTVASTAVYSTPLPYFRLSRRCRLHSLPSVRPLSPALPPVTPMPPLSPPLPPVSTLSSLPSVPPLSRCLRLHSRLSRGRQSAARQMPLRQSGTLRRGQHRQLQTDAVMARGALRRGHQLAAGPMLSGKAAR